MMFDISYNANHVDFNDGFLFIFKKSSFKMHKYNDIWEVFGH